MVMPLRAVLGAIKVSMNGGLSHILVVRTLLSSILVFLTCLCTYENSRFGSVGGTEGADALASERSSACRRCCCLIGIAEAVVVVEEWSWSRLMFDGAGEIPEGVPIEVGRMKSSIFMWSSSVAACVAFADEFRNCAIPLGAFCARRLGVVMLLLVLLAFMISNAASIVATSLRGGV